MGVVTFCPTRFAIRDKDSAGLAGSIRWHDVRHDDTLVLNAMGKAAFILARETPPAPRDDCEWCIFYDRWGIGFDNSMGDELLF